MNSIVVTLLLSLIVLDFTHGYSLKNRKWEYIDKKGDIVEVVPTSMFKRYRSAEDEDRVERGCQCSCRRKWDREYYCCDCGDSTCFPASSHVTLENGEHVPVGELTPDDRVLTADMNGKLQVTRFLGYMQRESNVISQYLKITTDNGTQLTLSKTHLLFVRNEDTQVTDKYAYEVTKGVSILVHKRDAIVPEIVSDVDVIGKEGAFVPLTEHGTLLVDDVTVSCYASFPHDMSHVAMTPLRWLPWLLDLTPNEGIHPFVDLMKKLGRAVLPKTWLSVSQISNADDNEITEPITTHGASSGSEFKVFVNNLQKCEI